MVTTRPQLPTHAYQTYGISRPVATHTRPASCAEISCPAYTAGWVTAIDPSFRGPGFTGQDQIAYLEQCGRHFTKAVRRDGVVEFTFPSGQQCFEAHRVPVDRPSLFVVKHGTPARTLGTIRTHVSPEDWRDDFAEHQDRIDHALNG